LKTHPSEGLLVAYRDGEVLPREHTRVEHHVRQCSACQATLSSLQLGIGTFEAMVRNTDAVDSRVEIGFLQLQDALENFSVQRRGAKRSAYWFEIPEHILATVRSELEIYLGPHAATRLLAKTRNTTHSSQELIRTIQPLMSGLLGTGCGAAVARRVAILCSTSNLSEQPSLSN
jgi:hypothetical protein